MKNLVIGIDPSLTGTAVIGLRPGDNNPQFQHRFSSATCPEAKRWARFAGLRDKVARVIEAHQPDIALCVIERAPKGMTGPNAALMAEYGAVLQMALWRRLCGHLEVSPSSLKKFATGSGASMVKKDVVAAHVTRRWGQGWTDLFGDSDSFDAYVLAKIGLAYAGLEECDTEAQREVIATLKAGPAPRKPRKRKPEVDPNW